MTTITFEDALNRIENATALYVDGESLVFPTVLEEKKDIREHGAFFYKTGYGTEHFHAEDNKTVGIDSQGCILLINSEGEEANIIPLVCQLVIT